MLDDLSYTTDVINGFGHQQAYIRSPRSSRDFIWAVSTSHAAGNSSIASPASSSKMLRTRR